MIQLEEKIFGSNADLLPRVQSIVRHTNDDSTLEKCSLIIIYIDRLYDGHESRCLGAADIEKAHKNVFPENY